MSETKRYYWLKLKEDFFEEKYIKALRKLPQGDSLVIVYLKMQLKSLKTEGIIKYEGIMPDSIAELSLALDEDENIVKLTVEALIRFGAVERWENDTFYMATMQQLIGSETQIAERVRKHRKAKALQCNTDVTKCNTDIEIDIDKDNIICPNSDDLDVSEQLSLEEKSTDSNVIEVNISETIERIYKAFPRKEGKAKGFEHAIAFLKGRKIAGLGTVKYNHEQLYCAVRQYSFECEDNHTEERYIKLFSTFMNKPVCDYVEKSTEGYESYMERTYGDEWRNVKFTYR